MKDANAEFVLLLGLIAFGFGAATVRVTAGPVLTWLAALGRYIVQKMMDRPGPLRTNSNIFYSREPSLVATGDETETDDPEDDQEDKQEAETRRRFIE